MSLVHPALEDTKVQADASERKAMGDEQMLKAEKQLERQINALMPKAEIVDAQEDQRYGKGNRGIDLSDELGGWQDRRPRMLIRLR